MSIHEGGLDPRIPSEGSTTQLSQEAEVGGIGQPRGSVWIMAILAQRIAFRCTHNVASQLRRQHTVPDLPWARIQAKPGHRPSACDVRVTSQDASSDGVSRIPQGPPASRLGRHSGACEAVKRTKRGGCWWTPRSRGQGHTPRLALDPIKSLKCVRFAGVLRLRLSQRTESGEETAFSNCCRHRQ